MPDYSKGKIYTIRSRSCDLVYIGSTTQSLPDRLSGHYRSLKCFKNGKKFSCASFQILERGDAYIELFEDYPCNSKNELLRYEGQCQRKYKCVNNNIAGRTQAEYREDNKDKISEYIKKYRKENKEKIKEQLKKYQQENKEKIKEQKKKYNEKNKENIKKQVKKYREENEEKIKEQKKKYYEENKEKIKEQKKEKITCEVCGASVRKISIKRHERTKKHQRALGGE